MSKTLMLALTLLVSAAWLYAQEPQTGSSQSGSTQTGSTESSSGQTESSHSARDTSNQTTVEGCLQGSNGSFTLTDNAGMTYQLEGNTSKLSDHVGHEVQVTGTTSGSSAASGSNSNSAMAPGASSNSQTLTVQKMKHISKTCKSMSK